MTNGFAKAKLITLQAKKIKAPIDVQQFQWVVQTWEKISKDVVINLFDVCGITTDNAKKMSCLRSELVNDDDEIDLLKYYITGNIK